MTNDYFGIIIIIFIQLFKGQKWPLLIVTCPLCLLPGQIFPDEGHFLSQQSHLHLYATLTSFYRECLKEELLPLSDEEEEEE